MSEVNVTAIFYDNTRMNCFVSALHGSDDLRRLISYVNKLYHGMGIEKWFASDGRIDRCVGHAYRSLLLLLPRWHASLPRKQQLYRNDKTEAFNGFFLPEPQLYTLSTL